MRLYKSEKNSEVLRGTTVESLSFDIVLQHGTVNTAIALADYDLSEIRFKATLKKAGLKEEVVVIDGDLFTLGINAALKSGGVRDGALFQNDLTQGATYQALGASADEIKFANITIPTGFIHLNGNDELRIEVQSNNFITSTLSSTESYIEVYSNEGVGVMDSVTIIEQMSVPGTQSRHSVNAGDNVTSLTWINHDISDNLYASRVVDNVSFQSSHLNFDKDWIGINGQTADVLNYNIDITDYDSQFVLYDNIPCYDAKVSFVLVGANNTTAKNFIVREQQFTTSELVKQASNIRSKHTSKNVAKLVK